MGGIVVYLGLSFIVIFRVIFFSCEVFSRIFWVIFSGGFFLERGKDRWVRILLSETKWSCIVVVLFFRVSRFCYIMGYFCL